MRNRIAIAAVFVFISFSSVLAYAFLQTSEPSYDGRRLSAWVAELTDSSNNTKRKSAEKAIRTLGPLAVPWIRAELRCEDSPLKRKVMVWLRDACHLDVAYTPDWQRRERACHACRILGSDARPAIPELADLSDRGEWEMAAFALANIGPEGCHALVLALANSTAFSQVFTAAALRVGQCRSNSSIEALLAVIEENNPSVQAEAVRAAAQTVGEGIGLGPGAAQARSDRDGGHPARIRLGSGSERTQRCSMLVRMGKRGE